MPNKFLHKTVIEEFRRKTLRETEVPAYIRDNLNPAFELREYQKEANETRKPQGTNPST